MSQTVKLSDSKMAEIRLLQGKFQELHLKFGTLYLEKMHIDQLTVDFLEKEKNCKDEWENIKKLEKGLLDDIIKTYGEGSLNLNDGTFTSSENTPKSA